MQIINLIYMKMNLLILIERKTGFFTGTGPYFEIEARVNLEMALALTLNSVLVNLINRPNFTIRLYK